MLKIIKWWLYLAFIRAK